MGNRFFLVGGGEGAKLGYCGRDQFERSMDFGFGGVASEAEADAGARIGGREPDGGEDVRGFDSAGGASGPGGAGETFEIESDDEGFAFEAGKKDVGGVWCARSVGRVCAGIRDAGEDALLERISEVRDTHSVFLEREAGEFGGFAQADDAGDIFGARTEAALVMAAVEKLAEARAALDEERANAFGGIELVAGDGKKIELERFDVDRNFPGGLHGVGMEVDVGFGGDSADIGERLDGGKFVVGVHHADENCFGANGTAEFVEIN